MSNKPMKAYEVRESDEGHCVIAFATNSATARREGGNELNLEFDEVESCTRAPWADEYAPGPVPLHAYLANGWWFECDHCGSRFDQDGRHGEGESRDDAFQPIESGKAHYYCSPTCQMEHWAEKSERAARQLAAIEATLIRWPMATGVTAYEEVINHRIRAQFTLPRVRYPVSWVPGEAEMSVSQCDIEEFKRLYGKPDTE